MTLSVSSFFPCLIDCALLNRVTFDLNSGIEINAIAVLVRSCVSVMLFVRNRMTGGGIGVCF